MIVDEAIGVDRERWDANVSTTTRRRLRVAGAILKILLLLMSTVPIVAIVIFGLVAILSTAYVHAYLDDWRSLLVWSPALLVVAAVLTGVGYLITRAVRHAVRRIGRLTKYWR